MILCCRCKRSIKASAVPPPHESAGAAAYGKRCAQILGLLPEPDLLKPRRRIKTRKPPDRKNTHQMSLPV